MKRITKMNTLTARSITMRTGTEGPRHDPYGYTEITFRETVGRRARTVLVHYGLSMSVHVNGKEMPHGLGNRYERDFERNVERATGLTMAELESIANRIAHPSACPKCRTGRHLDEAPGYPGESFVICTKCDTIVACEFHESEII